MGKKYGTLIICAAILVLCFVGTASARTWYVDDGGGADFTGIQEAIIAARAGDTIIVKDGTYTENIDVDKRLTIRSENGAAYTIVDAKTSHDNVFEVTADHVNISGFTVKGAYYTGGIQLCDAYCCNIADNICSNNRYGICLGAPVLMALYGSNNNYIANNTCSNNELAGINLYISNNNSISNNSCSNNYGQGINFWDSNHNSIANNTCSNNDEAGIILLNSNNNSISSNDCSNNRWFGIELSGSNNKLTGNVMRKNGILIRKVSNEVDKSNTVNEKPVYYWKDVNGGRVPDGAGQVILVNCSYVLVENQNLNDASMGIEVASSSFITIKNNNCSNNKYDGIYLHYSCNNSIANNTCSNNKCEGISLDDSNDNRITGNNANNNNDDGISLDDSNDNRITGNNANNNDEGICLHDSCNNSIANNTCSNNDWAGIDLLYSNSNILASNNCINNRRLSIDLYNSNNNSIKDNNYSNSKYGIDLSDSNNNHIYLNNFINNANNVRSYESTNTWNSTEEISYTYNGRTYTNYLGNYWDDYRGTDADGDGIGDTPYRIDGDRDRYPLMDLCEKYFALPMPGEWRGPAEFGEFVFIVNNSSTGISKISYNFSNWTCGPITRSGGVSIGPTHWPITSGQFTIETDLGGTLPMTIRGKFDETGTHASGNWEAVFSGVTCSGAWDADYNSNEKSNT